MELTLLRGLRVMAAALTACLLVACGSAPVVRGQPVVNASTAKMSRILFFYHEATLTSSSTADKTRFRVGADETGLYQFGDAMVSRATPAFQKNGVVVVHAAVVPVGEWQQFGRKTFNELGLEARTGAMLITVRPQGGKTLTGTNGATVDVVFGVRVFDAVSAKLIWEGFVDTSTWKGRDFLSKHVQGSQFDQAYADQFWDSVIATFRSNGLL